MYCVSQSWIELSRKFAGARRTWLAFCLMSGFSVCATVAQADPDRTPPPISSNAAAAEPTPSADPLRPTLWSVALQLEQVASTNWETPADKIARAAPANPLWNAGPDDRGPFVLGTVPLRTSSRPFRRMSDPVFAADKGFNEDLACLARMRAPECLHLVPARWRTFLDSITSLDRTRLIARVNAEVNAQTAYVSDLVKHDILEHWARPSETMVSASGDCEDYAILKYWLLVEVGIRAEDMFILVVHSAALSTHHAVLAVKNGDDDYVILDNLAKTVQSTRQAQHYEPVFSVNVAGLWLHGVPSRRDVAGLSGR